MHAEVGLVCGLRVFGGISGSIGDTELNCLRRQRISLARTGSGGSRSRAESVFASTIGDMSMRVAACTW